MEGVGFIGFTDVRVGGLGPLLVFRGLRAQGLHHVGIGVGGLRLEVHGLL